MTITSDFLKEDVDFVIEEETNPGEGEMEFNVRLITGPFIETLIGFKNLRMIDDPADEDEFQLAFDFAIKSTPDPDLTEKNSGLQKAAGDVLYTLFQEAEKVKAKELE
jgi:hypothetical protein